MINVGIAGIGFMGMIHYLAYQKIRGAKVAAMCETGRRNGWPAIGGRSRAISARRGEMMDLTGIARYAELDEMLADPKLDMIDVCLPPALHAKVTIAALKAGKHVFCEKPIALKPADANRMVDAAQKAGKLLMIGHVLPFFPEYKFAYKAIAERQVRPAARRAFQADHLRPALAARLLRPRQGRRADARPARPRRPFHPPGVRHAAGRAERRHACGAKWSSGSPRSSSSTIRRWWSPPPAA